MGNQNPIFSNDKDINMKINNRINKAVDEVEETIIDGVSLQSVPLVKLYKEKANLETSKINLLIKSQLLNKGFVLIYILLFLFIGLIIFDVTISLKYEEKYDNALISIAVEVIKTLLTLLIGLLFGEHLSSKKK